MSVESTAKKLDEYRDLHILNERLGLEIPSSKTYGSIHSQ